MSNKIYKCPFCKLKYVGEKSALMNHMENVHNDELHNLPPEQVYFNYTNKYALTKGHGKCVITGKPTEFNIMTCRYERYSEEGRVLSRRRFLTNMNNKYGVDTLLNIPEHQAKMLGNRGISGKYKWTRENGEVHELTYTGSYERKFLEFLDITLGWDNPGDIMAPAQQYIPYIDGEGNRRFHLPDFYITSLNLIVNIKSKTNQHYRLRDIEDELKQDEALLQTGYNYTKIFDNDFKRFVTVMEEIKKNGRLNSRKYVK